MRNGFYFTQALSNLKRHYRLYVPSLLTGIGLTSVFYIVLTLSMDTRLLALRGGAFVSQIMSFGIVVVGVVSFIMLLYTSSFSMRQRYREFGLYNVLGMEKRHIGRILLWEEIISATVVMTGGLLMGLLLYRLCTLAICRLLQSENVPGFAGLRTETLLPTLLFFTAVYACAGLMSRIRIARLNPVQLMKSESAGEEEPKVRFVLLALGILTLASGYTMALSITDPVWMLTLFFEAVLLVIAGTYLLYIAGSTAILKLLRTKKNWYYRKYRMISVSGLLHRMKRNAVGLAGIAILATMVLIMASTTVSMYAGMDDTVADRCPYDIMLRAEYAAADKASSERKPLPEGVVSDAVRLAAEENGLEVAFTCVTDRLFARMDLSESSLSFAGTDMQPERLALAWFMTQADYEKLMGEKLELASGEAAMYVKPDNDPGTPETLVIGGRTIAVTRSLGSYPASMSEYSLDDCFGFVLSDADTLADAQAATMGAACIERQTVVSFTDRAAAERADTAFSQTLARELRKWKNNDPKYAADCTITSETAWQLKETLLGMNSAFLFLGILLSIVFLFATALVIYFKQIAEGYEDRTRFAIMQKIGMSAAEVKKAISSQVLLVFFLPPATAAIHLVFAFPMLSRMLRLLYQPDVRLFILCTLASLGVFTAIYVVIYRITARTYYHIVTGKA